MDIQPDNQSQNLMSIVVRWGLLLLIAGIALVYFLLSQGVTRRAHNGLVRQQLNGQEGIARIMANLLDTQLRQGGDLETSFSELSTMMALQFGSTGGGLSLADPDGEIISQFGTSEFRPIGSLTALVVRDLRSSTSVPLNSYLQLSQPSAGLLYSGAGSSQHQSVAISKIAVNNWALIVHRSTSEIENSLSTIQLYLLAAFLCLTILLILFVLRFYYSLTGIFNSAVQSATALNSASQTFQESVGVMRSPLHNIQGLTDLLCMAADEDERERYAGEIKAEVGKIISMFKKAEF